jgi:hypothetical protein
MCSWIFWCFEGLRGILLSLEILEVFQSSDLICHEWTQTQHLTNNGININSETSNPKRTSNPVA